MKSRIFVAVMLLMFVASVNAVTVVDHAWDGVSADDAFYNSLTDVVTGNAPVPNPGGNGNYERVSLDAGDAVWQSFTTTEAILLDSIYIGYNDQRVTGTIRLALDFDGITYGGPYDWDTDTATSGNHGDIALSGLQTGGNNDGPVHFLQFDMSAENIVIPAGYHRFIIWGETEDGGDGFIIAPIRNDSDTYAGGTSWVAGNDDIFAITGTVPEPTTMAILGLGALLIRRKR